MPAEPTELCEVVGEAAHQRVPADPVVPAEPTELHSHPMQSAYPEHFERDMACTEAEWLGWLPGAVRSHVLSLGPGRALVQIDAGELALSWSPLPPRRIALLTLPRLAVRFQFTGLDAASRLAFMRPFDLWMQRGGG